MENNHSEPFSLPPPPSLLTDNVDQKSSLGFMELLGFQDFYSIFDNNTMSYNQLQTEMVDVATSAHHHDDLDDHIHKDEDLTVDEEASSVVLNGSPNCSSISSQQPLKQCMKGKKTILDGDETNTKIKKKKKEREARFAFMTRSEIDHLDDGYRWRKYGQKAVKNSHFPRSYYRCTTASCNVKKRVERCMGDPSYVVTTYEGQHIHPTPSTGVPSAAYSFNHLINPAATNAAMLKLDQGGLLQDMLHCHQ